MRSNSIVKSDPPGGISEEVKLRMAESQVWYVELVVIGLMRTFDKRIIFGMPFANEGSSNIQRFPDVRDGALKSAGKSSGKFSAPIRLQSNAMLETKET